MAMFNKLEILWDKQLLESHFEDFNLIRAGLSLICTEYTHS